MSGKLIVLEGGDGSGKATQTELLVRYLLQEGKRVRAVTFPNYESEASAPIRMYLAGKFGKKPTDVNAYVASTFYAIDRFASYRQDWQEFYESGGIVVADRYVTSNMVHQMTKCEDGSAAEEFLAWLDDLEYEKFALPRPDAVCLLDIPLEYTLELLSARKEWKDGQAQAQDIHEADQNYLRRCHDAYDLLVATYHWQRVECVKEKKLRPAEEIHLEIINYLKSLEIFEGDL